MTCNNYIWIDKNQNDLAVSNLCVTIYEIIKPN